MWKNLHPIKHCSGESETRSAVSSGSRKSEIRICCWIGTGGLSSLAPPTVGKTEAPLTSDKFLTRAWNNRLTLLLGVPTLTWAVAALFTPVFSDLTAFIGMVVFAVFY